MLKTNIIRQLWTIVETTQEETLMNLNESELVNWLFSTLQEQQILSNQQSEALKDYLYAHTPLIRDLADSRLFHN